MALGQCIFLFIWYGTSNKNQLASDLYHRVQSEFAGGEVPDRYGATIVHRAADAAIELAAGRPRRRRYIGDSVRWWLVDLELQHRERRRAAGPERTVG